MNIRAKVALISIIGTLALTILKVVFYFLSGSLAVLSEAWHGFSDVVTSVFVFLAVRKSVTERPLEDKPLAKKEDGRRFREILRELIKVHPELKVAFVIGLFLLFVSISLIRKLVVFPSPVISLPLVSGLIFIMLSSGSYFLYRFKITIGRSEKSAALISDGLHSKADMISTLLTGFSLIIYYFGIDLDKIVGAIIALYILSFAVETMVNVIITHIKKKNEYVLEYKAVEIFIWFFRKETFISLIQFVDSRFELGICKSKIYGLFPRLVKKEGALLIIALLLAILSSSVFQIKTDEEAIIERFGRSLHGEKTMPPGLHLKLPWPIDKAIKVNTKKIRELHLGNIAGSNLPLLWTVSHGEEIHFLSGDNNFFNPYISLHYRIKNAYDFRYRHIQPELLLENTGYRIFLHTFITKSFNEISISYRKQLESAVKNALQKEIDKLRSGIEIVNLNIKDIHPPQAIAGSFEEVIAAYQTKQERINDAIGYRNEALPVARGNHFREIARAEAYVIDKIKNAEGNNRRFLSQLSAFNKAKDITAQNLYFEAIGQALKDNVKILVDPQTGVPDLWMRFPESISNWEE